MAERKHGTFMLILSMLGGWIVGANVGARIAMMDGDCERALTQGFTRYGRRRRW